MNAYSSSLILIGMPGVGKSTIGLLLAKALAKNFVDTDILIQLREGKALQEILHQDGYEKLREIEEHVLLEVECNNHIIATGGSAVYSAAAMKYLKGFGPLVYLDLPLDQLELRIDNFDSRGIASPKAQQFADVFAERTPLYRQYADITIDCRDKTPDQIVKEIIGFEAEGYAEVDA